jgi:GT2 family glycosyltransferase
MNRQPVTDVVIVNHNSGQALRHCLEQLWQDANGAIRVFLVDNASSDESLSGLPESKHIKLIANSSNRGFAQACNQGLQAGSSQWVLFLNPDCFATAADIRPLLHELAQHPQAAMIGCRVLNEDGTLQAASRRRLPGFWRIVMHLSGLSRWFMFKGINVRQTDRLGDVIEVEAINGALMLGRRCDLEAIGGFDEGYPLHFEDLDLFTRLIGLGKTLLYDDRVTVTHLKGHSRQDSARIKQWKRQGLCRYLQKHRPRWEASLVSWLLGVK